MVTPGQEYAVTVNKWSIKNIESRPEVEKIVIPPMEPAEAEAIALDETNIYLKFAPPKTGDFDKFIISFESAYSSASFEYATLDQHPGSKAEVVQILLGARIQFHSVLIVRPL